MIGLIVAYSNDKTIGDNGKIPWNIKGEQQRFKELTTDNVVIMGRRSFEEIGHKLPNRINIIVSSTKNFDDGEDCITVSSLSQALHIAKTFVNKDVYICGGKRLYEESLNIVDKMFITEIHSDITGDTKFPDFDERCFIKNSNMLVCGTIPYTYVTYTKIKSNNIPIADTYMKSMLQDILDNGTYDENPRPHYKDGTPSYSLSVNQKVIKYDLSKNEFPLGTLRPQAINSAINEILWIYQYQTSDLSILENELNINWWRDWSSKDRPNTIGQRYGATVKKYDLMNKLLKGLKENPFGRRHIISLWQEDDFKETDGLMPCAFQTLWNVRKSNNEYSLDMTLIQRSSDWITAGLINEFQYCCLMMMVARHCGYNVGVFTHFLQNTQIYDRHIDKAKELISRDSVNCNPKVILNEEKKDFYSFNVDDFSFIDYPIETIKKINLKITLELAI